MVQPPSSRPTPALRAGSALLKLDSLRPSAGVEDRALALWDGASGTAGGSAAVAAGASAALAAAGWARSRGVSLTVFLHGLVPHEVREALRLWGAAWEQAPSREAALARAALRAREGARLLAPLDGPEAVALYAKSLGGELLVDLEEAGLRAAAVIAPSGAAAALAGAAQALRERFPSVQPVLVLPAGPGDVLPELPEAPAVPVPGAILRRATRAEAAQARAALARERGLLAGHGSALAARLAQGWPAPAGTCAVALVGSAGEREFSLDAPGEQVSA